MCEDSARCAAVRGKARSCAEDGTQEHLERQQRRDGVARECDDRHLAPRTVEPRRAETLRSPGLHGDVPEPHTGGLERFADDLERARAHPARRHDEIDLRVCVDRVADGHRVIGGVRRRDMGAALDEGGAQR